MITIRIALLTVSALALSACMGSQPLIKTEILPPAISKEDRTPCPKKDRPINTIEDIGLFLTDESERADCNATKLDGIDKTLSAYEAEVEKSNAS